MRASAPEDRREHVFRPDGTSRPTDQPGPHE